MSIINGKSAAINNSVSNNRKSPILNNIKKIRLPVYKRGKPPLYDKSASANTNSSSLPVIVNSLSVSPQHSTESKSPENLKSYELKSKIYKPDPRIILASESKENSTNNSGILRNKKHSHHLSKAERNYNGLVNSQNNSNIQGLDNRSNLIKQSLIYQGNSPLSNLKKPLGAYKKNSKESYLSKYRKIRKSNQDSKISLPSISLGRNESSNEREKKAKNLYLLLGKN